MLAAAVAMLPSAGHAETFTLIGEAWTCKAPGALLDVEVHSNDQSLDPRVSAEIDHAQCMPAFSPQRVTVTAFQGRYAFVCESLASAIGTTMDCSYALTRDLRDAKGRRVPDHVSTGSTPIR
jgi:hypothetical protein